MYETEANNIFESLSQVPDEVISNFSDLKNKITARTILPWSEHCTECVWPTCYATCDLYVPRKDGRCRRFVDGMVRIDCPSSINGYLLKIRFKRWGKLWTPGNVTMRATEKAEKIEQRDYRIGRLLQRMPLPSRIKTRLAGKRYSFKKRVVTPTVRGAEPPSAFVIECYNPELRKNRLLLTIRADNLNSKIPFQNLVEVHPGFQRVRIPFGAISSVVDLNSPFSIEVIPADQTTETTFYFGLMEFVREVSIARKTKTVKCVVWDLDNTLWDGILVEDGTDSLRLKEGIAEIIQALDERGILNSVASKNDHEEAMRVIRRFQLDKYFLYPQISWNPKSDALKTISRELNIGIDALLFVDDSEFELEQVQSVCPEVQTLDARHYRSIPSLDACQVSVTPESRKRRQMYQVESIRHDAARSFGNDYMAFLRDCNIELSIGRLSEHTLERVHELTQRTNQMNFSGNRYDRQVLKDILSAAHLDTYVLSCEDRFGTYGVVGFSIVDTREPRMTDLMFSCRIQSKRVEHAFLVHILQKYITECGRDFHATYRKTSRNAVAGQVFADLGMEEVEVRDGNTDLVFRQGQPIPDDKIIHIVMHRETVTV